MTIHFEFNVLYAIAIVVYCLVAIGHLMFLSKVGSDRLQWIDVLACVFFPIAWIYVLIMMMLD